MKPQKKIAFVILTLIACSLLPLSAMHMTPVTFRDNEETVTDYSEEEIVYSLAFDSEGKINGEKFTSSYGAHTITYETPSASIAFGAANKGGSNASINTIPVTKGASTDYVSYTLTEKGYYIQSIEFTFLQWTNKKQTCTLNTSVDNNVFTATEDTFSFTDQTTSSEGTLSNADEYTENDAIKAVKVTFSTTANQIGVKQVKVKLLKTTLDIDTNMVTFGNTDLPSLKVNPGDTVNEPDTPTKDGYVFEGWYTDETYTEQVVFPFTVDGDITIYAKWKNMDVCDIKDATELDHYYRITGKITARVGSQQYYIQDSTGALSLMFSGASAGVKAGDVITITGKLSNFYGTNMLTDCFEVIKESDDITITPLTEISDVCAENQCKYVEVNNLVIGQDYVSATNVVVSNQFFKLRSSDTYTTFINNDKFKMGETVNVKGIIYIYEEDVVIYATEIEKTVTVNNTIFTMEETENGYLVKVRESDFGNLSDLGYAIVNPNGVETDTAVRKLYDDKNGYLTFTFETNKEDIESYYFAYATIKDKKYHTLATNIKPIEEETEEDPQL